ncbi:unnamed protein product [Adineta ricciae]|uniref:Uncharacterized protein n=1 Tax=Adineta ricciae TaxID=249248 RepID=A0A814H182_ADIRI|nr:unnamed protein product [Adineta ricciae]CAF1143959.1 unnamed protein product [Adineta ricciae]
MNTIDRAHLARLRPEKFDEAAINEQILLIQQTCDDVDPEIISIVFHECNHNMQQTIARLQARDYEDGGWQKAKPNNKKKNQATAQYHPNDQIINGNSLDDNERSLSQRTSPTSSLRDAHRRNDRYQYSSSGRPNTGRRGNDFNRHHYNSSNSRYPPRQHGANRTNPGAKTNIAREPKPGETNPPTEAILPTSNVEKYDSTDNISQVSNLDHSEKKSSTQHISSSSMRQKPVAMHRTIHCSTEPIDIQFGDIQWKDSLPITVTPTDDDTPISAALPTYHQNTGDHEYIKQEIQDHVLTANEHDIQFLETTNQFSSSLSINDNTLGHNLSLASNDGTSHLSDHLTDVSSAIPSQMSSQPQVPVQIPITRLPPTSTPTPLTLSNNLQQNPADVTSSAFAPFNNLSNHPSVSRDYPQANQWNPQSSSYKQNPKASMYPTGTYPQQSSYQLPPQQQQIYFRQVPYHALSPSLVRLYTPLDSWSATNYSAPLDTYSYSQTNYSPTYSNQQQPYRPQLNRYDSSPYDKDFFASYGQTRSLSNDTLQQQHQQQSSTNAQSMKDVPTSSKLSPTAAVFSQGAPLTASPSTTTVYLNPMAFPIPNYVGDMTFQDRPQSHSSADTRDNRNGATYGPTTNRNNYHYYGQQQQQQQQQQRVHHNNSIGHLQQ